MGRRIVSRSGALGPAQPGDSLTGQFLIAMPNMGDERFERAVIYLCSHSQDAAMGFLINRTLDTLAMPDFLRQLAIVGEDEAIAGPIGEAALHSGGPVEPGRGFVLHSADYRSDSTLLIDEHVSLTATLEILRAIATGVGPQRTLIALGYAGWSGGQLEEEIAGNVWLTAPADPQLIFDPSHASKYERALRRLGIDPLLLSGEAGHA